MINLTKATVKTHASAIAWLAARNSDGCFDKHVAFAAGETSPFMRSTWNGLRDRGLLEFYNPAGKGFGRLRLTAAGLQHARRTP
jgi:hypothetical protein